MGRSELHEAARAIASLLEAEGIPQERLRSALTADRA